MKCPICNTATKQSGAHTFCTQCNFIQFTVTNDYMEASKAFIGTLVSNTYYPTAQAFGSSVYGLITQHLPMLESYFDRIVNGQQELLEKFAMDVMPHAINLHIGPEKHNIEELPQDLVCSCGCTEFTFDKLSIGKLKCNNCEAKFKFNIEHNRFIPEFTCSICGCNSEEPLDEVLSQCSNCKSAYMGKELLQ
ncbi:hypothetical protein D3C87_1016840 [compost metagenome]